MNFFRCISNNLHLDVSMNNDCTCESLETEEILIGFAAADFAESRVGSHSSIQLIH